MAETGPAIAGVAPNRLANALRFLALDGVEAANSGHAGLPMGMADVATVLFGQFLKFVAGPPRSDPRRKVAFRRGARGCGDPVHRAQNPPRSEPPENSGEGDDHRKRDQRVLQEVREGDVALVPRALELEVRVALGKESVVGMGAKLLGSAPR